MEKDKDRDRSTETEMEKDRDRERQTEMQRSRKKPYLLLQLSLKSHTVSFHHHILLDEAVLEVHLVREEKQILPLAGNGEVLEAGETKHTAMPFLENTQSRYVIKLFRRLQ